MGLLKLQSKGLVPGRGFEPPLPLQELEPESSASANSATRAGVGDGARPLRGRGICEVTAKGQGAISRRAFYRGE